MGCADWTDEHGTVWPVRIVSADGHETAYPRREIVTDEEGYSLHAYYRNTPPTIIVDGFQLSDPFPFDGSEELNPDKIPGTAEVMIESQIVTPMGITIDFRALAWGQTHHDDFGIYEKTFTNTGNVDLDDEIELPNQTVKDWYYLRSNTHYLARQRWSSAYGEYPADSLRLIYWYSLRTLGSDVDNLGDPRPFLRYADYNGEATIHADKSTTDHTDDPSQPQMTGMGSSELTWIRKAGIVAGPADNLLLYNTMKYGFKDFDGTQYMEGTYPGTHHGLRFDEQGYAYQQEFPWFNYSILSACAWGPYTFAPGESIKMVWAVGKGAMSPEKGYEVGNAWNDGTATFPGGVDDLAEYYPPFGAHPELAPTANDQAKDRWVMTGKDSLFQNMWSAQWSVRNDYNVPIPPPAPSIEVTSLPDRVNIKWGSAVTGIDEDISEVSDFAGYKVYRAMGNPGPKIVDNTLLGSWSLVFECGEGTSNALTHTYDDITAERGQAYYYYVAAFDNGLENLPGVTDQAGNPIYPPNERLESNAYQNRTTMPAYLTRPPGETLADIRVVPNPFNISSRNLQYVGEPDKIMFLNLPLECTIKVYTESGDLVKTIDHYGSGDAAWGILAEEHSATDSGQII
ncbi:hypothetical protein ACFL4K_03165, partial [Candidatus Neomarinimicrobiota bacterium]